MNIESAESRDRHPRLRLLAELRDDPRPRAISCALVRLRLEANSSQE